MSRPGLDLSSADISERELSALRRFLELRASNKYVDGQPGGLGRLIEKNASDFPDRHAIHFEGRTWTFAEFNHGCNRVANHFLGIGARKGMTCALFLGNGVDYITAMAGLAKIGVVSSLLNTSLRKKPLIHVIGISKADWIIVHSSILDAIEEVLDELDVPRDRVWVLGDDPRSERFSDLDEALNQASHENPQVTDPPLMEELAWYLFTSGTTGLPKAVKARYKSQLLTAEGVFEVAVPCSRDDVFYSPLPLNHVWGLITFCGAMLTGSQIVIRKNFSASKYWDEVREHNATVGSYIGEIPRYLFNAPARPDDGDNPMRRFVGLGLKAALWEGFKERFAIDEIVEVYGASEGGSPLINIAGVPGMVGRIFNPAASALVKYDMDADQFELDENGFMVRCAGPGDQGVFIVSKNDAGTSINDYTDAKATSEKILHDVFEKGDAWFNSGDLFEIHDAGWLSYKDRLGDTFRWKSENVSTQEVESILMEFPGVELAAVYGVDVPNMPGKAGMAAMMRSPDVVWDWDGFARYVGESLPSYAIPRFIRFREQLDLTATHKMKKQLLKEEAFDPERVDGPLYYRDGATERYLEVDGEVFELINGNKINL